MLRRALFVLAVFAPLPLDVPAYGNQHRGFAAHYRPGLMERVAQRRSMPQTACMVATPHFALGSWVRVQSRKNGRSLRCRVTDVPQPRHLPLLRKRNIVVELNFASARILCNIRRSGQEPPRACPVIVRAA